MSEAEERALETYPIFGCEAKDMACGQYDKRQTYLEGYHQAEKDLELTWEDINDIIRIYEDVLETESGENIYIKVLKRYKNKL